MDWSLTVGFWSLSLLLALTPGVDWAYAISAGLRRGGALPAVGGMLSGHIVAVLVVSAGVAGVITSSPTAMALMTGVGALYLVWLGLSALRHPPIPDISGEDVVAVSRVKVFSKGMGISLLNPKVFLLFLAMLPQFIHFDSGFPAGVQMIALGFLHILNCAVVYTIVGYGAGVVLSRRPRAAKFVGRLSGIVMIVLGGGLFAEQLIS